MREKKSFMKVISTKFGWVTSCITIRIRINDGSYDLFLIFLKYLWIL